MKIRTLLFSFIAWLPLLFAAGPLQQGNKKEEICPWCKNDPKRLEASGSITHGPIQFGKKTNDDIAKRLPAPRWIFLETKHIKFASSLGPESIPLNERARIEAELERLRKAFPNIPKKVAQLDPWLRIHLMAAKTEEYYTKFQNILNVNDKDFPASRQAVGPYMGDGLYLGEREKFEILVHVDRKTHSLFTEDNMGARATDALRWHFKDPHRLSVSIAAVDDLTSDKYLFPHVLHNATHLWFCAYKHFSFDPPVWLDEGLAHYLELDSSKDLNITFCSDEGAGPERERSKDYLSAAKTLIDKDKATSFAELLRRGTFADLKKDDHITSYAKVRFLAEAHAEKFAKLLGGVKGQLDDRGYPSGKDLPGLQRQLFKELWNWTPDQFDAEFAIWIKKQAEKIVK